MTVNSKHWFTGARRPPQRGGMVLVVVLIAIAMLTLVGLTFADLMMGERKSAIAQGRMIQARAAAESGIETVQQFLKQAVADQQSAGGCYDNASQFRGKLVADDELPNRRARFTLISPGMQDGKLTGIRYGLEDESTKVNLNTLLIADQQTENGGRTILMQLPGMTEDVADAILDWLDPDNDPRELGAEQETYSGMSPPYAPKNGPLSSLDELLAVRGVTPQLLYGLDLNRNGVIDPEEQGAAATLGVDNSDGSMDFGWSAYLTVYSAESNLKADGTQRVNLNGSDMQKLSDDLNTALSNPDWTNFIIAYRQFGPSTAKATTAGPKSTSYEPDLKTKGKVQLASILDLIGAKVAVKAPGNRNTITLESPFSAEPEAIGTYLPLLADAVTVCQSATIPGRINVNQASHTVLAGIPGMTDDILTQIMAQRQPEATGDKPLRRYETWLLAEQVVTLEQMKALTPYLCGGGSVYRLQSVGFFDQVGPTARIEAVVDASKATPRVLFYRELSRLGRGFAPDVLGAELSP